MTAMAQPIHLGISTCPNDTYAFAGILLGAVDTEGLAFEIELLDIAELNQRVCVGDFDVAKVSFSAALGLTDEAVVLPVGAALGYGVGPLLLAARPGVAPDRFDGGSERGAPPRVLCPGPSTTATMLYRMFYPQGPEPQHVVFSEIMPALAERRADFGVCIHEGRFTWESQGLHRVEDLGERWERTTGCPLPLGGIVARRRLGDVLDPVVRAIARSLAFADGHRAQALAVMKTHAQEMADSVIWGHVELYVNQGTRNLGPDGEAALKTLHRIAHSSGFLRQDAPPLTVWGRAHTATP